MLSERENLIFHQLLELFRAHSKGNPVYEQLCISLEKLDNLGRLGIMFEDTKKPDGGYILGYFDSSINKLFVVIYQDDYERKFLGFLTNWEKLNSDVVIRIMHTFLHEIMHYVAYNNTSNYLKIWNKPQKYLLKATMVRLAVDHGGDFLPQTMQDKKFNVLQLANDVKFNKAFEMYYAIVRQTDMIKYSDFSYPLYNKITTTLYASCDWAWARFYDNVFTTVLQIMEYGLVDDMTTYVYEAIRKAYIELFPGIEGSKNFNSLFYQELFAPSEIACIEATASDNVPRLRPLAIKTLSLV